MCGIFGISVCKSEKSDARGVGHIVDALFVLSESRGKEAAGIAVDSGRNLRVFKEAVPASTMIRSREYKEFFAEASAWPDDPKRNLAVIGHSRLVTNGNSGISDNNQPVVSGGIVGVHNGIIVNDAELWKAHANLKRSSDVDTEVLLAIVREKITSGTNVSNAVAQGFDEIDGAASVALLFGDYDVLLLATNNGSHYYVYDDASKALVFSSERLILESLFKRVKSVRDLFADATIRQLRPNMALIQDLRTGSISSFSLTDESSRQVAIAPASRATIRSIRDESANSEIARASMRRCTVCILPETFPFLEFDAKGVCSLCRTYQKVAPLGRAALDARVAPHRRSDDRPDCLVSISGGRDSSYGLHYVKEELKMNPVAYTYDWGLVTDLARRNISRLCGRLGVEHILISADIRHKRSNVRRNINAWLKRPALGMIPLFMAGDKQYFFHGHDLAKKTGADLVFFFPNRLERTNFKSGFCGVDEGSKWFFKISLAEKATLAAYFGGQILKNPAFLNRSLVDTIHAFYSTYFLPNDRLLFMFDYVPWDEATIMGTLRQHYDWEAAADTESTWRIGDGTASFYNYIYYTAAGFTEHDTFRSNQIREGIITRERGLELALRENRPRFDSIRQYSQIIGFDFDHALQVINAMPKLYMRENRTRTLVAATSSSSQLEAF